MIVQLGPKEEFQMTTRTVVRSQTGCAAMLFKHVTLQIDGRGEQAAAQVTSKSWTSGESVFNQMGLKFERRVELAGTEPARVQTSFRHQMAGHKRLDLGFSGKDLLTLDALITPGGWLR